MAGALHLNCATSNGVIPLLVGAEMAAASLLRCIEGDTPALLDLPALMDAP
jgi:hypothetical protein